MNPMKDSFGKIPPFVYAHGHANFGFLNDKCESGRVSRLSMESVFRNLNRRACKFFKEITGNMTQRRGDVEINVKLCAIYHFSNNHEEYGHIATG